MILQNISTKYFLAGITYGNYRLYRALRLAGIFLLLLIDVIKVFYSVSKI